MHNGLTIETTLHHKEKEVSPSLSTFQSVWGSITNEETKRWREKGREHMQRVWGASYQHMHSWWGGK